ncbi:MAG: type VI secretion system-associated protein TagF [Gammaproteobacteria bacterium]|nr:type VI secretion system-associated protein TagF [Gammaproteobacteria bacterium]
MHDAVQTGVYGKLPAYGDFVSRNLQASFINPWDEWLQHYIFTSREQLGNQWLDIYLTSPIWRFVLSSGVIDDKKWAGIIMPSVDRVGRYFPLSLARPIPAETAAIHFFVSQTRWYEQLESSCLLALNGQIDVDELVSCIGEINLTAYDAYLPTSNVGDNGAFILGLPDSDQSSVSVGLPYLLEATLSSGFTSFSVWQTEGSEVVSPLMFCCQGLPPISGLTSMLDGQWQLRNWKIPYNLKS